MRRFVLVLAAAASLIIPTPAVIAGPVSQAPLLELSTHVENVRHRNWHRPSHCHRSVRRHGRYWHRHVGPWCRTQIVRRGHHRGDCIWIGGVRICF
jgi:hypothetical protein